ncbi:hypothetical protein [Streptomyces sp. 11-1-2]|uniref:hypothetical protein n=1 Tax=unclassified Streptomyces TaxID=2593676 RepID=UPI001F09FBAC|nr:hypothetical protein [Streptomyces sp. 11-1-2]
MQAFKITTTDEVLADLRERLSRTRFRNDLPGEDWDGGRHSPGYGASSSTGCTATTGAVPKPS